MFFSELKLLLLMRSGSSRTDADPGSRSRMRGLALGDCGWSSLSCSRRDDEEEYYGADPRPRSLAFENSEDGLKAKGGNLDASSLPSLSDSGMRSPQCRICFQGPEKVHGLSAVAPEMEPVRGLVGGQVDPQMKIIEPFATVEMLHRQYWRPGTPYGWAIVSIINKSKPLITKRLFISGIRIINSILPKAFALNDLCATQMYTRGTKQAFVTSSAAQPSKGKNRIDSTVIHGNLCFFNPSGLTC